MTVKEAIALIQNSEMLLPAIQRKYVWSENQIIELIDSILSGYPIGTFLIWKTTAASANERRYSFYRFIANYHERDACVNEYLSIASFAGDKVLQGVLDGQQRLNSLLIALDGSYAAKLPRKRWNNPDAFPRKHLFFNLLSGSKTNGDDDSGCKYEFAFFDSEQAPDESHLWFKLSGILKINLDDLPDFVKTEYEALDYSEEVVSKIILSNLLKLHEAFCKSKEVINYYEVETDDMDEVLDIFVRTNSGGTILSKSDLLFSAIVSSWQDARSEFDSLIKRIADLGFRVDSDFIVHICLMLLDRNISLKVRNLNKETIEEIRNKWKEISAATLKSFKLLKTLGLNHEFIASYNAIIPIVYLAFKGCDLNASRSEIQKYLAIAQVKQLFSRSANSTLGKIRDSLRTESAEVRGEYRLKEKTFSRSQLKGISVGTDNFQMSNDDIDALFYLGKGRRAFIVLALLYPNIKLDQFEFHMDHLHPTAGFKDKNLKCLEISESDRLEWKAMCDSLANLQLLEGRENESKNKESLEKWLAEDEHRQVKFVSADTSYKLEDFDEFLRVRRERMAEELRRIFA